MRGAAAHLVDDHADVLGAPRDVDVRNGFHRARVRVLLKHVRHVVGLVGVADPLVVRAPLEDLLEAAMEVPHHGGAIDDLLARELEHEAQHAVRRRMLWPHVEDELLDLALFGLDRRELIPGGLSNSP